MLVISSAGVEMLGVLTKDSLLADLHSSQNIPSPTPIMYSDEPIYEQTNYRQQSPQSWKQGPPTVAKPTRNTIPRNETSENTNNLCELDNLLDDLNAAQIGSHQISVTSPSTPSASETSTNYHQSYQENMINNSQTYTDNDSNHYEKRSDPLYIEVNRHQVSNLKRTDFSASPSYVDSSHVISTLDDRRTASNATRELDDLLASLSDFKVTGSPPRTATSHHLAGGPPTASTLPIQPLSTNHSKQVGLDDTQNQTLNSSNDLGYQGYGDINQVMDTMSYDLSREGVNTVPKGHCASCNKVIVGQVITALGRIWHPEHFVCCECKTELGTCNFFERDCKPYCEVDYYKLFSPKCAYCQGAIIDKCVTALNQTWHPEHFICSKCGQAFGESGFHERNGQPYCRNDYYEMFAPKCGGCCLPIMDNFISAIGKQWHPDCFICQDCHKSFGVGSFFEHNSLPYCETHYHEKKGSLCASCQQPISGRCITAMYKKFHPEHFTCTFCQRSLNKGTFKEQNNKAYCHPCFQKLFG